MTGAARRLPTRDLAFAAYPQREPDAEGDGHALREALRGLHAAWRPIKVARLPAIVQAALDAARHEAQGRDDAEIARALPALRAQLRASGLGGAPLGQALALVAEIAQRRLGLVPYPSQLLAAWLMLDGKLAEMATGEGKTLAAGLAAATAALAGVPVHLLTANDYLVQRDRDKLGPLFDALGLTSACVLPSMARAARDAAYRCDIVYLTARELAFDYLRDHLLLAGVRDPRALRVRALPRRPAGSAPTDFDALGAVLQPDAGEGSATCGSAGAAFDAPASGAAAASGADAEPAGGLGAAAAPALPGLCLAIVDEADSILLDEASVPLILAEPADAVQAQSYRRALAIARSLRRGRDYRLDAEHRRAELGHEGRARVGDAVQRCGPDCGLLRPLRRAEELVEAALSACHGLRRDRDYAVIDGRVQLIDEVTGRIADGRQWTGPLQAMVELKEGLAPSPATRVAAQITYQRFFPRYLRVGGMSGTLAEARQELRLLYDGAVRRVPLARPDRRQWCGERLYADTARRDDAIVRSVRRHVACGRPVLVGTDSVAASVRVSACLHAAGIDNQLLNAVQDADEAASIARAGRAGIVTVATNIAGRGTDICLDAAAHAAGGLHVIAAMRNRARRIDRQLIGRAARHGDPGSAERLLALDDALFTDCCPETLRRLAHVFSRDGRVPAWLAHPLAALAQRRAEFSARSLRRGLQRSERQADALYGFAGGTE